MTNNREYLISDAQRTRRNIMKIGVILAASASSQLCSCPSSVLCLCSSRPVQMLPEGDQDSDR
jgi:hypothetical protein